MMLDLSADIALARATEAVAQGATWDETREWLEENFPNLNRALIPVIMTDALFEAESFGIEKEDIDPSWYR